ncbi:hypothetical protein CV102_13900 [Natronococcus pandeyae]|uniref:SRPBCC family protein n=1 Tax=Natronococcus pandeyae TaxID=2055836 RepID=A0A8J8PZR7_9EURY|nr:hypothetical protein [Natronococcus pandeyae]TYL37826.1 hypothetical protein CV102_13900 [Natronococcus pandeyae]
MVLLLAGLVTSYHVLFRSWHRTWGATDEEISRQLPGDDLVPEPSDETTRAITVEAPSEDVWPWIMQLGQGRGGFYSYTRLENLVGADIHNVDRILPELQELEEGDSIRMVHEEYWLQSPVTSMTVRRIEPDRTLVLQGHDGGTWTFHLDPVNEETTRFIVRGRKPKTRTVLGYVLRYLAYELPHFIMERGLMRGIKGRAERLGQDKSSRSSSRCPYRPSI